MSEVYFNRNLRAMTSKLEKDSLELSRSARYVGAGVYVDWNG